MKQSKLFTKTKRVISSQEASINAQLLERAGFISKLMAGVYSFLPLGLRVLNKIEQIVKEEMNSIDGQELLLPALQPKDIWETTDRWNKVDVLYKLKGSGDKDLALGPTHEEVVTPLAAEYIKSYKDLPQKVYQIQTKFRNEARPKSGLLRGREFRMKDLYSFHINEEDLNEYYNIVKNSYLKIFKRCGLLDITYVTYASGGIFSKYSHEFQTITPFGEDIIYVCDNCKTAINKEIIQDQGYCPECNNKNLEEKKAIEVGNIFKLKTRFSDSFNLKFTDKDGSQKPVIMGCYGLGTSRLMGAIVEIFHDDKGIIWPEQISPYDVHLISLLKPNEMFFKAEELYNKFKQNGIDVLLDDREVNAGEKFADSDLIGISKRIVISNKTLSNNSIELKYRNEKESTLIPIDKIIELIRK